MVSQWSWTQVSTRTSRWPPSSWRTPSPRRPRCSSSAHQATQQVAYIQRESWQPWQPFSRNIQRYSCWQMKSTSTSIISASTTASLRSQAWRSRLSSPTVYQRHTPWQDGESVSSQVQSGSSRAATNFRDNIPAAPALWARRQQRQPTPSIRVQ